MLMNKSKKVAAEKRNMVLIMVNVLGSAGPMRFVVNEKELVAVVIDMVLKSYARERRLPVLGSNLNDFLIYCPSEESDGSRVSRSSLNICGRLTTNLPIHQPWVFQVHVVELG